MSIRNRSPARRTPILKGSWTSALGVLVSAWLLVDQSLAQQILIETVRTHTNGIEISWSGPKGAYTLQRQAFLGAPWEDVVTIDATNLVLATVGSGGFLRLHWQDERTLLPDFSLGPYPSAFDIFRRSVVAYDALNVTNDYQQVAESGYLVQATARFLHATMDFKLPGGETDRQQMLDIAMRQVDRLKEVSNKVLDGGPAFGLDKEFVTGGHTNPPFTAYTWQSGLVSLGVAELCRYLKETAPWHPETARRLPDLEMSLAEILGYWTNKFTRVFPIPQNLGYFWYSDAEVNNTPVDNVLVHNVNALMAMACQIHTEATGVPDLSRFGSSYAELFSQRWWITSTGGYAWHYADDGVDVAARSIEDVSHALSTLQVIPFGVTRGWYSLTDARRVETTLLKQIWTNNPARVNGRVDGSSGGTDEWEWTSAASIGYAANANTPGGIPELFDFARSMLVSSYLTPFNFAPGTATMDAVRLLSIATLFAHRPTDYLADSQWSVTAGDPLDNAIPTQPGGVRFYTIEWSAPQPIIATNASFVLTARVASVPYANILIDLPDAETRRVAVSLTYRAANPLAVSQWNGSSYTNVVQLPSTRTEYVGTPMYDQVIWMRTTIILDPTVYYDYEPAVPGKNVLLEFSGPITLHRIEATPVAN